MNRLKNKVIKTENLCCLFLIMPFVEPLLFKESGYYTIDTIYSIFKIISTFIALILNLKQQSFKKFNLNKAFVYLAIFEGIIGLSTILYSGDVVKYCGPVVNVLGLSLLTIYYYPRLKENYFKQFINLLIILAIINGMSVILFPNGITQNAAWTKVYFLGIDNRFVFFYLPLVFFVSIYELERKSKLTFLWYFVCGITLLPLLYLWSVGAIIGLLILIGSIFLFSKSKKIAKINFNKFFIIILLLNVLIVFLNIQNYFADFLVNVLKKDITLSGRTFLWEEAIELIKKYPLIGCGVQSNEVLSRFFYGGVTHPHNLFLTYLINGGIVGMIFYLLFIKLFINNTKKIMNLKIKFVLNITIFTIFLLSLADTLDIGLMYVIFIIGIMYSEVEKDEKSRDINIT